MAKIESNQASKLDSIDHIALEVNDIEATVSWYLDKFDCSVSYQDETWAMLQFANMSIAFVLPREHPSHIGIVRVDADKYGQLKRHRDGSESCYVDDPGGNVIEVLRPYLEAGQK